MNEFNYTFPSMTSLDDHVDVGDDALFGFTTSSSSHYFPKDNNNNACATSTTTTTTATNTFIITEEMSVMHKSSTNQCSVHVRGTVSLEGTITTTTPPVVVQNSHCCEISIRDPHGQLLDVRAVSNNNNNSTTASNSSSRMVVATRDASNPNAFRLKYLIPTNGVEDDHHPVLEYTCGDAVRPVPMLITTTTTQEVSNNNNKNNNHHHQILFTLRVNPRNTHSLLNTVVLVHVPPHFDGASAQVSSVGRSIGRGELDTTQWNEMTRILSWKLGELYSGAICEFEAIFPPLGSAGNKDDDDDDDDEVEEEKTSSSSQNAAMFPVLLRYDCEGSLLSDVDLDWSGCSSTPIIKRRFRVYHREV